MISYLQQGEYNQCRCRCCIKIIAITRSLAWALRSSTSSCLTSSLTLFGCSGRVTHATVILQYIHPCQPVDSVSARFFSYATGAGAGLTYSMIFSFQFYCQHWVLIQVSLVLPQFVVSFVVQLLCPFVKPVVGWFSLLNILLKTLQELQMLPHVAKLQFSGTTS